MAHKKKLTPDQNDPDGVGAEWRRPPPGWTPVQGLIAPNVAKATEEMFIEAVREQLVASDSEELWRSHARELVMPELVQARVEPARAFINAAMQIVVDGDWPTLDDCIPSGSFLDAVDSWFWKNTDIAREIPFFLVIHYLMAMLTQQGVHINKTGQVLKPDLFTIVIAKSGSGKTMSQNAIAQAMGDTVKFFPGGESSITFLENMRDFPGTLFVKDEFAHFLREIEEKKSMEGIHRFILKAYDGDPINYNTRATKIDVHRPELSLLGFTPTETLAANLSPNMMLSGFAQRMVFSVAIKDERARVPDYDFRTFGPLIAPMWAALCNTPFHPVYFADDVGIAAHAAQFHVIMNRADELGIGEDFSRRLAFRCHRYALAYHILTGKKDNKLHSEDYAFAAKLTAMGLRDLRKVLDLFSIPKTPPAGAMSGLTQGQTVGNPLLVDPQLLLQRAKEVVTKFAGKGKKTNSSNLGGYIKKQTPSVLHALLVELAADPAYADYIELPKPKSKPMTLSDE